MLEAGSSADFRTVRTNSVVSLLSEPSNLSPQQGRPTAEVCGGCESVVHALTQRLRASARIFDSSFRPVFVAGQGLALDILDPAFAHVQPLYERAFAGTSGQFQFPIFNRLFEIRAEPLLVEHRRVRTVLALSWDITGWGGAGQTSEEVNRRKDRFIATLAHELRQPLSAIVAGLAVMRTPTSQEAGERARSVIERQVQQLNRLTDDLLDAAALAEGKVDLRLDRVDLREIVLEAVDVVLPLMQQHQHQFGFDLPEEPVWIQADAHRLHQVLSNVLINATKFTSDGGRILLQVDLKGPDAVIAVRDSGKGIAAGLLPYIFEVFTQAERGEGLGIGLAVARHLIERHGGTITAQSAGLGRGSEFTIRLPTTPARP